jgi:hypothetical protein
LLRRKVKRIVCGPFCNLTRVTHFGFRPIPSNANRKMSDNDSSTTTLGPSAFRNTASSKNGCAINAEEDEVSSVDLLDAMSDSNKDDEVYKGGQPIEQKETPPPNSTKSDSKTSSSPIVSPATQTLNLLSQDMQDLRYGTEQPTRDRKDGNDRDNKKDTARCDAQLGISLAKGKSDDSFSYLARKPPPLVTAKSSTTTTVTPSEKEGAKRDNVTLAVISPIHVSTEGHIHLNDLKGDWEIFPIRIHQITGKLGIVILRSDFAKDSMTTRAREDDDDDKGDTGGKDTAVVASNGTRISISPHTTSEPKHCKILKVIDHSLGQQHGIQVGDWICHPSDEARDKASSVPSIILATFGLVQEWSKKRPFCVTVLRPRCRRQRPAHNDDQEETEPNKRLKWWPPARSVRPSQNKNIIIRSSKTTEDMYIPCDQDPLAAGTAVHTRRKDTPNETSTDSDEHAFQRPSRGLTPHHSTTPCIATKNQEMEQNTGHNTINKTNHVQRVDAKKKVPFCRLCNHHMGPKPRMHHAWCQKNGFFHSSGARELLKRIQQGKELGCGSCCKEFDTGRLLKMVHIRACVRNQAKLKEETEKRERKEQEEEKREKSRKRKEDAATKKKRKREEEERKNTKNSRRSTHAAVVDDSLVSTSDSSDDDDDDAKDGPDAGEDDDESAYRPTDRRPIQALSIGLATSVKTGHSSSSTYQRRKKTKKELVSTRRFPAHAKESGEAAALATDGVVKTVTSLKSNWVNYQTNPWGPSGHVEGDVPLYGGATSAGGLGSYEGIVPSNRYTVHPFERRSNYRSTHVTPEEGLTLLQLTRDPMATRSWGFRISRDEFGHACLVEGIDPLSPATAAVSMPLFRSRVVGLEVSLKFRHCLFYRR